MKLAQLILVILLSIAASAGTFVVLRGKAAESGVGGRVETAAARVLRTGELRCGYFVAAPYLTKDAATGQMGGIWYHVAEGIGAHLGLKVVWAEEVGLGEIATALQNRRIDVYCGGLWTAGKRVRVIDFLKPTTFEALQVWVREDDHRFDQNLTLINDPAIRISTIDGEGGGLVGAEVFPKATMASLPQLSSVADMINQVLSRKADLTISSPSAVNAFNGNNAAKLRALNPPLRVFPVGLAVAYGEPDLRDMLNQAQDDLLYNGDIDRILDENEAHKGDFWHPTKPYNAPSPATTPAREAQP